MIIIPPHCRSAQLQAISRLTGHHPFGGDRPPEPPPPWPLPPPPRDIIITIPFTAITIIFPPSTRLPRPIRHVYSPFFFPRVHQLHHHQPYLTKKINSLCKLNGFPSPCPLEGCWRPWSPSFPSFHHFRASPISSRARASTRLAISLPPFGTGGFARQHPPRMPPPAISKFRTDSGGMGDRPPKSAPFAPTRHFRIKGADSGASWLALYYPTPLPPPAISELRELKFIIRYAIV